MGGSRDIGWAIFGFGFGIWSFLWGFGCLRKKRMIENIPTSSVRSLAMGLVELTGKTYKDTPLKSAITHTACVFYRYKVERYERSGKNSHWRTVAQGSSAHCPFWLDDGTGRVRVLPIGAECILPEDYQFRNGLGRPLTLDLVNFLDTNRIGYKALLGTYDMRFTEWFIRPGEEVYVLGTAKKMKNAPVDIKRRIELRLEELRRGGKLIEAIDENKDGVVSNDEWDKAMARMEKNLLEKELKYGSTDELSDVVVTQGDTQKLFILSDHSQNDLLAKLGWQCSLGIFGGSALTVFCLWYLLLRFNVF